MLINDEYNIKNRSETHIHTHTQIKHTVTLIVEYKNNHFIKHLLYKCLQKIWEYSES